jgi:tetratricopeptide (TPR) repeat protein
MIRFVEALPASLRRHLGWLVIVGIVGVAVGGWFAYQDIPSVHFKVMVAWAKVYDTFVPHQEILPTPVETTSAIPTFSLASLPAVATATAQPGSATETSVLPATSVPFTPTPLPDTIFLKGVRHEKQYFNNCGPTTLAMALSFWGWEGDQHTIQPYLRPNKDDKNLSPSEMAVYLAPNGFDSVVRVNGDIDTLKRLLAAGYPVILEKGLVCHEGADRCEGWVGHYSLAVGYTGKRILLTDAFLGEGLEMTYLDLLIDWRAFNYTYVVVFPAGAERRAEVLSLLGSAADVETNYREALARAEVEAENSKFSKAAFAWFNAGSSLVALGDYADAAVAYDQARHAGIPFDLIWYQFGPYQAYAEVGRYEDVEHLASFAISTAHLSGVEEAYYWRGRAREALGRPAEAEKDYRSALEYNLNYQPAEDALLALMKNKKP